MFYTFFSEINIKKSPMGRGKVGEPSKFLLEVELLVFTNIQAITTLVCHLLDDNRFIQLMCNYSII